MGEPKYIPREGKWTRIIDFDNLPKPIEECTQEDLYKVTWYQFFTKEDRIKSNEFFMEMLKDIEFD